MRITQNQITELYNAEIVDVNGDSLGRVGQVYLDDHTGEPAWVTAKTGFFGTRETFVPLAEADLDADRVRVPYEKSFIKDAPNMDADQHLDEAQQAELYRYYGLSGTGTSGVAGTYDQDRDLTTAGTVGGDYDRDRDLAATGAVGGDYDRDRELIGSDRDRGVFDDDRDRDDADRMTLHEERVNVGTERVESGRVRLRKHVVTDTETVTVPVEREEYEIVREPASDSTADRGALTDDEIEVTTYEERPVVEKDVVATEQVGVERRTERDEERVTTDVSREEVELEETGGRDLTDPHVADREITDPDDPSRRL